ncbi:MAG: hydrogenase expression/formation protein HypE [Clostridiales bacterium]|nr:hydrogenase expression/formation protein HypE [Clostridiales bacterium]HBM81858.1 hydrogenase expression/formation protein HypE [Clostridiaceae bacterium]
MDEFISLSYGSGGRKTSELINEILLPEFSNSELNKLNDGACIDLKAENIAVSTDSFVVKPVFFSGGDIGKLAVCGTVNDLSVCGARPEYLTLAFIIEEGFKTEDFKRIVKSISNTASMCDVRIVTGDTKVVERGHCDGIYINTSGIGIMDKGVRLGKERIMEGDKIIVSGTVGDHGITVMSDRNSLFESSVLKSDCAPVYDLTKAALKHSDSVKIMRDPTRGGIATTLNEFIEGGDLDIKIYKDLIPVKGEVKSACDILGIDPLYAANEGKIVAVVSADEAEGVLSDLKVHETGRDAAIIGEVHGNGRGRLLLDTGYGSTRILNKLSGSQLPRIC